MQVNNLKHKLTKKLIIIYKKTESFDIIITRLLPSFFHIKHI